MADLHIFNSDDYSELLNYLDKVVAIMNRNRIRIDPEVSMESSSDLLMEMTYKLRADHV